MNDKKKFIAPRTILSSSPFLHCSPTKAAKSKEGRMEGGRIERSESVTKPR